MFEHPLVAVYTLTRDRLKYTQECFAALEENAGIPFDHYIVDNGSMDGTLDWLSEERDRRRNTDCPIVFLAGWPKNEGISVGSNACLGAIQEMLPRRKYKYIMKIDNDCMMPDKDTIKQLVEACDYQNNRKFLLSPRVEGINNQPTRAGVFMEKPWRIEATAIVGGLCHIAPAEFYLAYRFPADLPKAWGQDDDLCEYVRKCGGFKGYVEQLLVIHHETTDGQAHRYPEYFQRKRGEEIRTNADKEAK